MKNYINKSTRETKSLFKTYVGLLNAAGKQKKIFIQSLVYTTISSCLFGISLVLLYPLFEAIDAKDSVSVSIHLSLVIILLVLVLRLRCCQNVMTRMDTQHLQ